jgi:hypothetical protein
MTKHQSCDRAIEPALPPKGSERVITSDAVEPRAGIADGRERATCAIGVMERLLKEVLRQGSIPYELNQVLTEFALVGREPLLHAPSQSFRVQNRTSALSFL